MERGHVRKDAGSAYLGGGGWRRCKAVEGGKEFGLYPESNVEIRFLFQKDHCGLMEFKFDVGKTNGRLWSNPKF